MILAVNYYDFQKTRLILSNRDTIEKMRNGKKRRFCFDTAKFHVDYGPNSLFDRVRYKMGNVTELRFNIPHYQQRVVERNIPEKVLWEMQYFDAAKWSVESAEVRTDSGKFISSTWVRKIDGRLFSITIGLGNSVVTIYEKNSTGTSQCIRSGPLYDFVSEVNQKLMNEERV